MAVIILPNLMNVVLYNSMIIKPKCSNMVEVTVVRKFLHFKDIYFNIDMIFIYIHMHMCLSVTTNECV